MCVCVYTYKDKIVSVRAVQVCGEQKYNSTHYEAWH